MSNNTSPHTGKRIVAIDVLRGMTVAGMILVNNPGSWTYRYAPVQHAEWNGLTPTDLVFPFFLFIMGVSMYISLSKHGMSLDREMGLKILRRSLLLIVIGWVLDFFGVFLYRWFSPESGGTLLDRLVYAVDYFPRMRILGVFPRLGLTYGFAALLLLTVRPSGLRWIAGLTLVGYGVLLALGSGYVYGPENILGRVDRAVLGVNHMYNENGIDPEGVLSTIPAIVHVLVGALVGERLFRTPPDRRVLMLVLVGGALVLAGVLPAEWLPINKKVWSPTFVLVTCGLATMLLGLLIRVTDERGWVQWCGFFRHFGANALFTYLLSYVLAQLMLQIPVRADGACGTVVVWEALSGVLPSPELASLTYALLFVGVNWIFAYLLYRREIFIKL